ncbi:MAG: WD40 repeat domain-containing protein [Fimbriiglobus sp.]
MQILKGRRAGIDQLCISPDSRYLAGVGIQSVHLWDLHAPDARPRLLAEEGFIYAPRFLHTGQFFWHSGRGLRFYDPGTDRKIVFDHPDTLFQSPATISPTGQLLIEVIGTEGLAFFQIEQTHNEVRRHFLSLHYGNYQFSRILFTPDGEHVFIMMDAFAVVREPGQFSRTTNLQVVSQLENIPATIQYGVFTPRGDQLLVPHTRNILAWDTLTGGRATAIIQHATKKHFRSIAVHPDGELVGVVNTENTVSLYSRSSGELLKTYAWKIGELRAITFTPDGTRCITAGTLGKVLVFDLE